MAQLKSTIINGNLTCSGTISCSDARLSGGGGMSLKELNTYTEGVGTIYSGNAYPNGSWVNWSKIGHIVHINFWIKINSNPSQSWTGYLIAKGLPKAANASYYAQGVCIDNYRSDAFAEIKDSGDLYICARMTPIANQVIVGGFSYIT